MEKPSPLVVLVASAFNRAGELLRAGGRPERVMEQVSKELVTYAIEHNRQGIPSEVFRLGPEPDSTLHVKKVA